MIWNLPADGRDVIFCAGPDAPFDPATFQVTVSRPESTGIALAVLRARVDDDHDLEETVWATCSAPDVNRSAVELALLMSAAANSIEIDYSDSLPVSARRTISQIIAMAHHHRQVSWLLVVAQRLEALDLTHRDGCATCRARSDDSPLLVRARFLRDLADGLALGNSASFTLHGIPPKAAVDACWFLMQTTERELDVDRHTLVRSLTTALIDTTADTDRRGPGRA